MEHHKLSNKALLVSLKISQWSARKFDRKETAALAVKHGTPQEAARVNKSLLPMAASLDAIHKETNAWRWDYYRNTLPWNMEGVGIIRSGGYLEFANLMRERKLGWMGKVTDFLGEYEDQKQEARRILNGMYREEDYPELDTLRAKFSADVAFYPLPEDSAWEQVAGLTDEEREELIEQAVKDRTEALSTSMRDAWKRLHEVVTHAHDRLNDPKAIFRDSLIEGARDVCRTMSALNITDDPNLEKIRQDIEGALCSHNPDTLRSDPLVRSEAASKLDAIMSKMGAFYQT